MDEPHPFPKRVLWFGRGRVRGVRRLLRNFRSLPAHFPVGWFPERDLGAPQGHTHWCLRIPVHQYLAEGPDATLALQQELAGTLLATGERLRASKPPTSRGARVVTTIVLPMLWDSRICVLWDDTCFLDEGWLPRVLRDGPSLTLHPTPSQRSLRKEWGLLQVDTPERGVIYDIKWNDAQPWRREEAWFYGDIRMPRSTAAGDPG
jgi:hypothetical protein